ncbi:MAG: precorrin-3B C(17)-methyltransferase [Selenomonadaceae bacterium]|nr:precorrin-3B C(17)-methyltransferase [Selenomonadaceae bacterium]MBQ1510655.1 precorrin-3B C(17)-methyltransferase [Selenomonadaceae bacterium]MBQ1913731.1 precorrin-3B C(17)-methyltransferase [Selenomonadaceae bacterium]MBQ3971606.1 precorrin-3B C(17)-methyltransferase [Selenomonadaceae bacterium]
MGKITVIGLGPGSLEDMTPRARKAIEDARVVAGYNTYIKLIESILEGKEVIGTGMMQEIDRCRMAVETAAGGRDTVVVSSGDSGVYGMAGLVLELVLQYPAEKRPEFDVIAGISAVNAAAAVLGAPLMHDFAVISLSDLLTPWETIRKRVQMAAEGDFVLALYNPKSKKRVRNIEEVREILLRYKSPETPVGIVTSASREAQGKVLSTLQDFTKEEITMFSLVIIGNSKTYVKEGYMITPRGYENKEPTL